ncbi:MAG: recombinase family protein, partial [Rubrobacteraceae bacterium]
MDQLAKFERAKTVERTRRGSLRKVSEGRVLGGAPKPRYGFRWTKDDRGKNIGYEVYEPEMATVRRILAMVADGASLNGVSTALQADGVPAPEGGRAWGRHTIREMVRNDLYRPHGYGELEGLVAKGRVGSGVLAALDRGGS